jgi:flagella basal body P-ring formation protein FlgA
LDFTPPAGVNFIQIVRPGGMRATLPPAGSDSRAIDAAVRRGETVTITYAAPGISLSMRGRAMQDGAVGDNVTFLNTTSNRQIDAVVTAPGQALATP